MMKHSILEANFTMINSLLFAALMMASCSDHRQSDDTIYLKQIQLDQKVHRQNVVEIDSINSSIVKRIDSLFDGTRSDITNTDLVKGIMNTRSYNKTILAYREILNGDYVQDANLKLRIARHIAYFEGMTESKRSWDNQWDITARPYLYKHGLSSKLEGSDASLWKDPEFRSVLWDRRMFAHDVEIWSPRILASADTVLLVLDMALSK